MFVSTPGQVLIETVKSKWAEKQNTHEKNQLQVFYSEKKKLSNTVSHKMTAASFLSPPYFSL